MKKIQVMVVDDSALVRQALTQILNHDPEIEVCAKVMLQKNNDTINK
jgi:two-component system chemotaxis response regulator CheB